MQDYVKNNPVILGLRRIRDLTPEQVADLIEGALAKGIHYFDIADIYSGGQCESNLGAALKLKPYLREKRFIQTKCGIVRKPGEGTVRDLSKEHILEAVDASLNRRGLTYVDSLLLHRPDVFRNNEEIHAAFKQLYEEGKVKHFGVSNRDTEIIDYLEARFRLNSTRYRFPSVNPQSFLRFSIRTTQIRHHSFLTIFSSIGNTTTGHCNAGLLISMDSSMAQSLRTNIGNRLRMSSRGLPKNITLLPVQLQLPSFLGSEITFRS